MFNLETFINNIDVYDKFGIRYINVDKSVSYRGSLSNVSSKKYNDNPNCFISLAAAIVGLNNTATFHPTNVNQHVTWTDIDTQEKIMNTKPTCYIILGKPGSGTYSLGEALSKKLKCVHICPRNVIIDEINQKSPTGLCLDFNMKHNNPIKFSNILSIMIEKLKSSAIKHRGYIISGLPLVSSDRSSQYLFTSMHGEESILVIVDLMNDIIYNLKKKPRKVKELTSTSQSSASSDIQAVEEEAQQEEIEPEGNAIEEEEGAVELPKFILDSCSDIIIHHKPYFKTKKATLLNQFNDIIALDMPADIIIYLSCPDIDLTTKKFQKLVNYASSENTMDSFSTLTETELRWPVKYNMNDYTKPYEIHTCKSKYNCRQPINFKEESMNQICNYRVNVFPYVEKKLKDFDPKYVIKLDARVSNHEMIHQLMERLIFLQIRPVLVPEPLLLEEPFEDIEEFWKYMQELYVIQSGVMEFRRCTSTWYNRCPVALKQRQSLHGNSKYAVTFLKHIYLLSSLSNMISFCINPRPYLKLQYLEPTCRVIVIGTKSSGKTLISECLSWLFDTPVIDYKLFFVSQKQKKKDIFAKRILSEIIATIEDARFEEWQSTEMERYSKLEMWCTSTVLILNEYIPLLIEYIKYQEMVNVVEEQKMLGIESQSKIPHDLQDYDLNSDNLNRFLYYKKQLSYLPFLDNVEKCEQAMIDKKFIIQFAPENLKTMKVKPGVPSLGDEDVTKAISAYIIDNSLQKDLEPTVKEMMNEMVKVLSNLDMKCKEMSNLEQLYSKFIIDGLPPDPEYWEYLSDYKLLPDYTIALIENRELDSKLMEYYINVEKIVKNYQQRFLLSTDPLVKIKLTKSKFSELQKMNVQIVLNDVINSTINQMHDNDGVDEAQYLTSFTESVEKFREDWDSVKLKLEENRKCFIEVELENKTDVQMIDDVLLGFRKCYTAPCEPYEDVRTNVDDEENGDEVVKDLLVYNNRIFLCETNIYCPVSYYDYGILWEGKTEFGNEYNNKIHYFSKEECVNSFQKDPTKYQSYNQPYKKIPPPRICIIGSIGCGKTSVSKYVAKELGLLHINFIDFINNYMMPKHFKKVGRQYENSFTDLSLDNEPVIEFQMDEHNENMMSDILSNESELRRIVYNYFEHGTPILPTLMQKIIKKIWFEEPFLATGFVLDGYPRLADDVDNMITCFCIPDLVIALENSVETSLERLSPVMFKTWKNQLNEAKNKAKIRFDNERKEWMGFITKHVVVKLISDEIFDNIFLSLGEAVGNPSTESLFIDANPSGSSKVDANLFKTYNLIIQEFPEPDDKNEWEKAEEAQQRIDARIESIFDIEDENINLSKELLFENKIRVVTINAMRPFNKVIRLVLLELSTIRNRNQSFFEETYITDLDIAEVLLTRGFYFLSKFNRLCPVLIFSNPNITFNPYKIYRRKGKLFPVIHRSYIYFIAGEENLKKFRLDPLKYVDSTFITSYLEYPLRISIIGAPKTGKSELAQKLSRKYGLLCTSRGVALRKVLETMSWTALSSNINRNLHEGISIDPYLVMKCVQLATIDHRAATYGYVFDGFPETALEAMELKRQGLYPNIVFDISCAKDQILNRSQKEIYYDIIKIKPPYSKPFIQYRYTKWTEKSEIVRNWINEDYQNMYVLNGNNSRWQCVKDAVNIIHDNMHKVNYYLKNEKLTIVPADGMCISNEIFEQRMSQYKNMCPLCLNYNILRHSEYPVDRKGIVQFRNKFYWFCEEHINGVLKDPHCIMTAQKVNIPEIPAVVKTVDLTFVYENGVCIVTYAENLPNQMIEMGNNKFAASFQGKTYLFCSLKCLQKFIEKPNMYCDIEIFKERELIPNLFVSKLPNLGYLEQTIGKILTEACCSVNAIRPKYPGLSTKLSGLIFLALYLKTQNPQTNQRNVALYEKALKTYEARCKLILGVGLRLRSMDNPFAKYPVCCRGLKKCSCEKVHKSSTSIMSSTEVSVIVSDFNK